MGGGVIFRMSANSSIIWKMIITFGVLTYFTTRKNQLCSLANAIIFPASKTSLNRSFEKNVTLKHKDTPIEAKYNIGSNKLISNKTIFGAIIFSDYDRLVKQDKINENQLRSLTENSTELSVVRSKNAWKMLK